MSKMERKRAIRAKKKNETLEESAQNVKRNINWFPGHMTRAKREMSEKMKSVDMIIELRDSRIVNASKNPMIDELAHQKPRLILLTKTDKSEKEYTEKWIQCLTNETTSALALDLTKDALLQPILKGCMHAMSAKHERDRRKGIQPRAVRAMVVGIPNVGKSTMINRLAKRKVATTADRPGVTRALKTIKIDAKLELLDTPGILWPKFDDKLTGLYLALTGAINDQILDIEDIATFAMDIMLESYQDRILKRYEIEMSNDSVDVFTKIGKVRGFLKGPNEVDLKKTAASFIRDIRDDKFGPITWEKPYEDNNE